MKLWKLYIIDKLRLSKRTLGDLHMQFLSRKIDFFSVWSLALGKFKKNNLDNSELFQQNISDVLSLVVYET